MANYHLTIKIFSRGKTKSAVAAAAYRAAEKIKNERDGLIHDYTRKGGVVHTEIILPNHAPIEYADRSALWNAVEEIEKPKNAQLAREVEISLPVELTAEQNLTLAREFVKSTFVDKGMCADLCVHDKNDGNPHAHILLTMRPIEQDGSWGAKSKKEYILDKNGERIRLPSGEYKSRKINTTDWNEQSKAEEWRSAWEFFQNSALERYGHSERVDHRSYERQGLDNLPTVHMGVAAAQMEQKGISTARGNKNRNILKTKIEIELTKKELAQTRTRIKKLKNTLYSMPLENPPTMLDMWNGISKGKNLNTRWGTIQDLKIKAEVLMFLQNNGIFNMESLGDITQQMNNQFYEVSKKVQKINRRLDTLDTYLVQAEIIKKHKAVYDKYNRIDPQKRDAFYIRHGGEIRLYEDAKTYFEGVMNGRDKLPVRTWRDKRERLTAERYTLCEDYYRLKKDVGNAERLIKSADEIMRGDTKEKVSMKSQYRGL